MRRYAFVIVTLAMLNAPPSRATDFTITVTDPVQLAVIAQQRQIFNLRLPPDQKPIDSDAAFLAYILDGQLKGWARSQNQEQFNRAMDAIERGDKGPARDLAKKLGQ